MPGRHVAPRSATLSWPRLWRHEVRRPGTRRAMRVAIVLLSLLTTSFLVLVPRAAESAYDRALGDRIVEAEDGLRDVNLRLATQTQFGAFGAIEEGVPLQVPTPPFERVDAVARERLGPSFLDLVAEHTHAAQTDPFELSRRDRPLTVEPPQAVVRIQSGLVDRVAWVTGAAPGAPTDAVRIPLPVSQGSEPLNRLVEVVPVGLAETTAELWGIEVGDRLDLSPVVYKRGQDEAAVVDVVGIFRPLDPADPFWRADGRLLGTASVPTPDGGSVSQGSLLAGEDAYVALSQALQPFPEGIPHLETSTAFEHTWRYRLTDEGLSAGDADVLREGVAHLRTATGGWNGDPPSIATGLPSVLDRHARDVQATSVLTLFASAGVAALSAFTLMAGVLALLSVRRSELRLLAARGASRDRLVRLVAGDAAVWVLPAVVLGGLLGGLHGSVEIPWRTGALVAVVALAPIAMAVWAAGRVASPGGAVRASHGSGSAGARARRIVVELAVTTLAVLLVVQLRRRAETIAGGSGDWIAALVPAVVGLAVGLVVIRLVPLLARMTTALAARSRSATPLLAGAGQRAVAAAVLPILAIVVGTALASLLATVGSSIASDRDAAAYQRVGADARIEATRVDQPDVAAVEEAPGVGAATAAYVSAGTTLVGASRTAEVELMAADVAEAAAARAATPVPLTTAERVADEPVAPDGALAIALSRAVLPDERLEIRLGAQRIPARVVAVDPALARVVDGQVVDTALVALAAVQELAPIQPTTVLVTAADGTSDPLTDLPRLPLETSRQSHDGVVAATAGRATSRFVTATFLGSAALAAVLLGGAVALTVVATRGSRAVLGHRAAILGMPRRGQWWSELLGLLPAVLLVALAGAALGSVLPRLVGPAIDLTSLTGAVSGHEVPPRPLLALGVGIGTVLLTLLFLTLDRRVLRREPLSSALREGDQR